MSIADQFSDILTTYQDAKLLKEGGQKSVFLFTHPIYGQAVLKIGIYTSPQTLERISREVRTLRGIDSPYYPKNHEFDVLDSKRFVIIEEYVKCMPLSDCINQYVEPRKAVLLLRELVNGLSILWSMNIVHRDLKPDNILITSNGSPKIIDLGIARLLDEESLTKTYALSGPATPPYAAPEQLLNRKAIIDIRTDQFNLGIILVQLLLGGFHPFNPQLVGSGIDIMNNIIENKWFKSFLDTDQYSSIKPLANRLLGKEPYMRFRKTELLVNAINLCLEGL